jgi:hypothetical protein
VPLAKGTTEAPTFTLRPAARHEARFFTLEGRRVIDGAAGPAVRLRLRRVGDAFFPVGVDREVD